MSKKFSLLALSICFVIQGSAHAFVITDGKKVTPTTDNDKATPDKLVKNNNDDLDESRSDESESDASDLENTDNQDSQDAKDNDEKPERPICSPDALAVGIQHFSYDEIFAEDLVWSGYGGKNEENKLIHKDVKEPLQTLVKAAAKDKVALYPSSIFRSVRLQDTIIKRKIRQKQPPKTIYHTSSPAGYSEHHTGYAVDFAPIDAKFAKGKGYKWLMEHAHEYGWEQTFTKEYSEKSGVSEESWHWRYVGDERGQAIFAPRECQAVEIETDEADTPDKIIEDNKEKQNNKETPSKQ